MLESHYAIVPAAGVGSRLGGQLPKQFMTIGRRTVLDYTLQALLSCVAIKRIVVILSSSHDLHETLLTQQDERVVLLYQGGETRAHSVLNGLNYLAKLVSDRDWVLVHDAARPCVQQQNIEQLITTLKEDDVGGILALPMSDTMKLADDEQRVLTTQDRRHVWAAQTPQMFRYGLLKQALTEHHQHITDESSAIELLGLHPKLIHGSVTNIKITYKEDLNLAEGILKMQGRYD